MKQLEAKEASDIAKNLLQIWIALKKFFLKANSNEPLTKDDERQFLEMKSEVAKIQRTLGQKLKDALYFGGDKLQNLLRQAISVSHLRNLPVTDKRILYKEWHVIFILVTRVVGALEFIQSGYIPSKRSMDHEHSIAHIKGMAGSGGERGGKSKKQNSTTVIIVIIVLIGAAAAYFLFFQS